MDASSHSAFPMDASASAFVESEPRAYDLEFQGLALGKHEWVLQTGPQFFAVFPEQEFRDARFEVRLVLDKQPSLMEFRIFASGSVEVDCDRSARAFRLPIEAKRTLVIRLADQSNLEDDELVFFSPDEHRIESAQWIYETLVSAVPLKRVHPDLVDVETPETWVFGDAPTHPAESDPDPRWDKLKDLLNS
ncbi:hypothetical protein GC167_00810 [bacterium]|nr:hypothetical protein [bacterium]